MKVIAMSNPQRYASRALDTVGEALTLYAELRRFMKDCGIDKPTFSEVTLVARKMTLAGALPYRASQSVRWMSLEFLRRIGDDCDLDTDTIDYLADDLMNGAPRR